ncbi:hypothetical protein C922_01561 [Plasmodium inui San Antonio 1]|uniref:Uncharacterized protein n=1 Tax=Plasmodium inui San Antonio 1 TaxID=1237626 RepID=W7AFZ4_9APIC|nr:hypothetical protein C922_01561 [Plasmodium inui San Antonio 1]EUD67949.1 hypothetical protein C922_01561 [Plasmodium inui San Antonio 1]
MTTIRWMHRKGQNCEKRVISLNEIKERYLNDAANQRKDKRNENSCPNEINPGTEKKKGKKKLITFYQKKEEKNIKQRKGLSEKNANIHFGKKKYCCSGEKGETKNGCSECSGKVGPLLGQYGMSSSDSDLEKGTKDRPLEGENNLCPPHHAKQQVNINLDVNIQWNKQNGKFQGGNCNVGDMRTFHGDEQTWQTIQDKTKGKKQIHVSIRDNYAGENGNGSEFPIPYEQGRSRKGEVSHPRGRKQYKEHFPYGNLRERHYHQHSDGEYSQRSRDRGNHNHGGIPNPLHKNRHINCFEEECTTYDGTRPAPYVPLEESSGNHPWGNFHYETEKEQSQFRYDSGVKLHPVQKIQRHGVEAYEGGVEESVHLYVKQPHPSVKQTHLSVQQLQQNGKNPLADPLKTHPPKGKKKYAYLVDPKRICSDGEGKRINSFQKRTGFFQASGKHTDTDLLESNHFSELSWIGEGKTKKGGSQAHPPECLPPPNEYHKTAYLVNSEEVLLIEAKKQKLYEQDKKKKKIILSINTISNILKKKIFNYVTRWKKHSLVRGLRPVYKTYSKIVSSGENHPGDKKQGSLSAVSERAIQYAFPRRGDIPLRSFQKVPNEGNCSEKGIPRPMGEGLPQDGDKEETPLREEKKNNNRKKNSNRNNHNNGKEVSMEEAFQKREVAHYNVSGVSPYAKKNSRENLKLYRQLSQRKVLTNTLIDSFIDVDIHDQRKKKKYLKFFSILLCLFLRRHMHRQLSSFFSVIGSCHRRQEEKRSIRKFINSRLYAVSILEGALKRSEKKEALRKLALLEEKRDGNEAKQTHKHYRDHPIESNSTEERSVMKSPPHHVGSSHRDKTPHDHRVSEGTQKNKPKLTSSRSHEKPCFGKPKIFRTDDFAIFFNKKILKEKDDILQKCLLRSKSDALLDFLKMTKMENFSKKATCSSAVLNFPDGVYYNDDMRSSTLLDRFFTATYSPDVRSGQGSVHRNVHKKTHRDRIHLSFYEHMTDNSTLKRSSVNYQQDLNKRETHMHFKRECFATGGLNCVDSTSQSSTRGKERRTTNIADAVDAKMGSISEVMNKLGYLIGDSNFFSGVTPGRGGDHMDDSSEEDVNDKRCRMFFKHFKKQLTMKCKGAAAGEEHCGEEHHSGEEHLCDAGVAQNGLSLSDLNSTVGISKGGQTYTHRGGCRNGNRGIAFIHP